MGFVVRMSAEFYYLNGLFEKRQAAYQRDQAPRVAVRLSNFCFHYRKKDEFLFPRQ